MAAFTMKGPLVPNDQVGTSKCCDKRDAARPAIGPLNLDPQGSLTDCNSFFSYNKCLSIGTSPVSDYIIVGGKHHPKDVFISPSALIPSEHTLEEAYF